MNTFDIVFVVLVYRNTNDLVDFFKSLNVLNCKVIVVNSFFDEASDLEFKKIAERNGADFISVPNKGYGAGNNRGCEHALKYYEFKYLIISNADITIRNMNIEEINPNVITAPEIITRTGKRQNPAKPYDNPFAEWLIYKSFTGNKPKLLWLSLAMTKILREWFYLTHRLFGCKKIYEVHGANIIFPYHIVKVLTPIFNEDMFLFAEEDHLARLAKKFGFSKEYNTKVIIDHKEDGSVGLGNVSQLQYVKKSFVTYYESWKKGKY